jgi:ParB-like nuclease domain
MTIIWDVHSTLEHEVKIDPGYEKLQPSLHRDIDFEILVQSIKKHGQIVPGIVNSDYVILDGHHRYKACQQLGLPFIYERMAKSRFPNGREDELDFILDVNLCRAGYAKHGENVLAITLLEYETQLANLGIEVEFKRARKGPGVEIRKKRKEPAQQKTLEEFGP